MAQSRRKKKFLISQDKISSTLLHIFWIFLLSAEETRQWVRKEKCSKKFLINSIKTKELITFPSFYILLSFSLSPSHSLMTNNASHQDWRLILYLNWSRLAFGRFVGSFLDWLWRFSIFRLIRFKYPRWLQTRKQFRNILSHLSNRFFKFLRNFSSIELLRLWIIWNFMNLATFRRQKFDKIKIQ